jgi:hypothetical protein
MKSKTGWEEEQEVLAVFCRYRGEKGCVCVCVWRGSLSLWAYPVGTSKSLEVTANDMQARGFEEGVCVYSALAPCMP